MYGNLQISIEENRHGVIYFEMTDGVDVVKEFSVAKCLKFFGIYASEDRINEWTRIAYMNDHRKR